MTSPEPKVGDKIRISDTGTVLKVLPPFPGNPPRRGRLLVQRPNGRRSFCEYGPGVTAEIEILQPAYVDGGIYVDADGELFRFSSAADDDRGGWYEFDRHNQVWETNPHARHYATSPVVRVDR